MPAALTYPGVYIQEVASGVRTIVGVATSITAFIGRARRGPTDGPTRVQNFADFERVYGGLWEPATLGYAVQHFFANGGGEAVIARVHRNAAGPRPSALSTFSLTPPPTRAIGVNNCRVRVTSTPKNPADNTLFNIAVTRHGHPRHRTVSQRFGRRHTRATSCVSSKSNRSSFALTARSGSPAPRPIFRCPARAPTHSPPVLPRRSTATATMATTSGHRDHRPGTRSAAKLGLWMFDQVGSLQSHAAFRRLTRTTDVTAAIWNRAATFCADHRAVLIVDSPAALGCTGRRSRRRGRRGRRRGVRGYLLPAHQRRIRSRNSGRKVSRPVARSPESSPAPTPNAASGRRRPAWMPPCSASPRCRWVENRACSRIRRSDS